MTCVSGENLQQGKGTAADTDPLAILQKDRLIRKISECPEPYLGSSFDAIVSSRILVYRRLHRFPQGAASSLSSLGDPRKAKPRRSLDPEVLLRANEPTFRAGKAASALGRWRVWGSSADVLQHHLQAIMPTTRETILSALHALLQCQPATVLRGEVLPERVPAAGLLILRDGDPGEPSVTLSPLRYHYQHRADVEAVVQTGTGRDTAFDLLVAGVGTVLAADRTLGGLCARPPSAGGWCRARPGYRRRRGCSATWRPTPPPSYRCRSCRRSSS